MRKLHITAVALFATILLCNGVAVAEESTPSKREVKLSNQIEQLQKQLQAEQQKRGLEPAQLDFEEAIAKGAIAEKELEDADEELEEAVKSEEKRGRKRQDEKDLSFDFSPEQIDLMISDWRELEAEVQFNDFFKNYVALDIDLNSDKNASARETKSNQKLDSLYKARLMALASPIELPYNSIVRSYINRYVNPDSKLMSNVLSRSKYYFPDVEEQLTKHNLPVELRAMVIIESAVTSLALSHAGAMGLWQFMPATGRMYKLEINSLVDERCDPAKATIAACKFMADLYRMYGDWSLAIAAYNCGPGNVNKALARSGLKRGTFWDIYEYLPRETRGYVPAFIAATYAYAYHKQHNIESPKSPLPIATDTVTIRKIMHLEQVSSTIDVSLDMLRQLNPQYRKDIIPATNKSYALVLPRRYISTYIANEKEILAKDKQYLKSYIDPKNIEQLKATPTNKIHVVKSGDTLSAIAKKYRVTTKQLMTWNKLKSAHKLSIGQRLKVSAN